MTEWLENSASIPLLRIEERVRFPRINVKRTNAFVSSITQTERSFSALFTFMKFAFTQVTQEWLHFLYSFSREKLTQDEKVYFTKGNELKITQVELLSFFIFKSIAYETLYPLIISC